MFKTILFDLDDTIFDSKAAERAGIFNVFSHFNLPLDTDRAERFSEINASLWRKLERNEIKREVLVTRRFELLFNEFNIDASPSVSQKLYIDTLSKHHDFMPGAIDLLESIYKTHDLYIVSNGTPCMQIPRIHTANIEKYFKDIFISQQIGHDKPDVRFFENCFKRIENFDKKSTIIVGDKDSSDILGGKNAGIATCLFNPNNAPFNVTPDFIIKSLSELHEIIK